MVDILSLHRLDSIPSHIARPTYDPRALIPGIVHIGVGNFHRAHQAIYMDDLFCQGYNRDWAIIGAGVRHEDTRMRAALHAQDWLTTVVEQEHNYESARITAAMVNMLPISIGTDHNILIEALVHPDIRIVSLTITEGGYFVHADTGQFDIAHPDIVQDARTPHAPRTVFGIVARALAIRKEQKSAPFTLLSCDNVPHNGDVTRQAVVELVRLTDADTAQWIDKNVAFPNSMVDRITPATPTQTIQGFYNKYGYYDNAPVFCERFKQWVIEDHFCNGRPELEHVGVHFVPDVTPYETMKIRILNGGHAVIAYAAGLLGIDYVDEAMRDPLITGFLDAVIRGEVIPIMPPVQNTDVHGYLDMCKVRFANPALKDTIKRLCWDGSNRQSKFIVPSIRDRLVQGLMVDGLALVSALWCCYCLGMDEQGQEIADNDPHWQDLQHRAGLAIEQPQAWLGMQDVYGNLAGHKVFERTFVRALQGVQENGVRSAVQSYLSRWGRPPR